MNLKTDLGLFAFTNRELGLRPTRKSMGFLLDACVTRKDLDDSRFIWNEYEAQDLRHDIFCFVT